MKRLQIQMNGRSDEFGTPNLAMHEMFCKTKPEEKIEQEQVDNSLSKILNPENKYKRTQKAILKAIHGD